MAVVAHTYAPPVTRILTDRFFGLDAIVVHTNKVKYDVFRCYYQNHHTAHPSTLHGEPELSRGSEN